MLRKVETIREQTPRMFLDYRKADMFAYEGGIVFYATHWPQTLCEFGHTDFRTWAKICYEGPDHQSHTVMPAPVQHFIEQAGYQLLEQLRKPCIDYISERWLGTASHYFAFDLKVKHNAFARIRTLRAFTRGQKSMPRQLQDCHIYWTRRGSEKGMIIWDQVDRKRWYTPKGTEKTIQDMWNDLGLEAGWEAGEVLD
ncbi:hypothetical protein EK21DRAFT_114655 [Setomelanomma holmii]|uniref:Uncharacterized protein n=1 Tax=Setomelanomma holmii TaxID=210430 RepID=A0A9P4H3G3_9PLEO|nr:hypothetical protein EK21DRAFT_114655 [Setomelanomma holmii]